MSYHIYTNYTPQTSIYYNYYAHTNTQGKQNLQVKRWDKWRWGKNQIFMNK